MQHIKMYVHVKHIPIQTYALLNVRCICRLKKIYTCIVVQ